jgi:chemotaxis protein MotB
MSTGLSPELAALRSRLAGALTQDGLGDQVELVVEGGDLVIRLSAGLLFESGRAELKPAAIPVLDRIGQVLAEGNAQLSIEGHSDSDPMLPGSEYPDNWALSSARATGVLRFLHDFDRIPYERLATAGYAETRPVASNETPAGKARNRRVEIRVRSRS